MRAEQRGGQVVITLTAKEAADLEDELLWVKADFDHSIKLWETLSELTGKTDG